MVENDIKDMRLTAMVRWLQDDPDIHIESIRPASGDASFRRYFRVSGNDNSLIVMDAPPEKEDVRPFIHVARLFREAGIEVPEIYRQDLEQGFLLLSDLGPVSYLDRLNGDTAHLLYGRALETLLRLQTNVPVEKSRLPLYDEALLIQEMELFRHWFLQRLVGLELAPATASLLDDVGSLLAASALEQPKVCVHRDYHSRNLMADRERGPGVLDFQDAVIGPVTYDLVSLLRDCYIAWPQPLVDGWVEDYFRALKPSGIVHEDDSGRFVRWFDLMGLQRHLKAIGIFSRLKLRDDKHGYVKDIPRTMGYVMTVCERYPELRSFGDFLNTEVLPLDGLIR